MNQDSKPEMSRHEASWHEHLAGMRAAAQARAQGGDPSTIDALASASLGPVEIGGFKISPASQGTIWALQRVAREWKAHVEKQSIPSSGDPTDPGTRELIELGLATLAFCDARECWKAMDRGEFAALIERAESLMWDTPIETQMLLQSHFQFEMERVRRISGGEEDDVGKSKQTETPDGVLSETETPPPDTGSRPANG